MNENFVVQTICLVLVGFNQRSEKCEIRKLISCRFAEDETFEALVFDSGVVESEESPISK